jgi:hypothetical protein
MNDIRFMYLRDESGRPRVTIAYKLAGIDRVQFGYAVQNVDADKWDREIGRKKALGRFNSNNEYCYAKVDPTLAHKNNAVMAAIVDTIRTSEVPTRMKRAAQLWVENMWRKTSSEPKSVNTAA